jgi:hypothetical protein
MKLSQASVAIDAVESFGHELPHAHLDVIHKAISFGVFPADFSQSVQLLHSPTGPIFWPAQLELYRHSTTEALLEQPCPAELLTTTSSFRNKSMAHSNQRV